jgi:hypothetical protein
VNLFKVKNLFFSAMFIHCTSVQSETMANQFKSEKSYQIATQLQRIIDDKLQQIIMLEIAAGGDATKIKYTSLQNSYEHFGTLISANTQGLVISVTPNTPASRLGLISGDIIVSANGVLLEENNVNELIEKHSLESNHTISLKIIRDNRTQYLSGEIGTLTAPAWTLNIDEVEQSKLVTLESDSQKGNEACGRIIVGKYMPREEDTPYRSKAVFIKEIDGVKQRVLSEGFRGNNASRGYFDTEKTRFKLSVGEHKIVVEPRYSNNTNRIKISDGKDTEFLMTIAADTSYYLVYDTRKDSPYSKTNTPVIWQTKSQNCEF